MMVSMINGSAATQEIKDKYNDFIMNTFGFSFKKWHDLELWDDDYEIYFIEDNNKIVANVSVYKMNMLIKDVERDFLQFGAVATREEYRGKGLSKKIFEHIFSIYPDASAFLYGGDDVIKFYEKLGFRQAKERKPYIQWRLNNDVKEMNKLNIEDPKVVQYLQNRNQFSHCVDCTNQYAINWFHILMGYSNDIYEVPELELMLVAEQNGSTLEILDVAATKKVDFSELAPYLHFKEVETIEFGFNPDWLNIEYLTKEYKEEDSNLLIKGPNLTGLGHIIPLFIIT